MSQRRRPADSLPPDPHHVAFERTARLAELGVLTASLVHELKQPLMALKGLLQLQQHTGRAPSAAELLEQVAQIEELLDHYSGFGRIDEPPQVFDPATPVRRAVEMLRHRSREQRVALEVELPEARVHAFGRPMALQQVVVNLLQNALDAVDGRAAGTVKVAVIAAGGEVCLTVTDNGIGVDPSVRDRLFEPFVTSKPVGRGTGLGLHIARRSMEDLGGSLVIDDAEGGGTRVTARFPEHTG